MYSGSKGFYHHHNYSAPHHDDYHNSSSNPYDNNTHTVQFQELLRPHHQPYTGTNVHTTTTNNHTSTSGQYNATSTSGQYNAHPSPGTSVDTINSTPITIHSHQEHIMTRERREIVLKKWFEQEIGAQPIEACYDGDKSLM
eukprot:Lankesteria_metandrocarpae@DN7729_c0_g1_i1.p1